MRSGHGERCGELWSPVERIGALAALDFDELLKEEDVLALGEAGEHGALGLDAKARAAQPAARNTDVRHCCLHGSNSRQPQQTAYHRLPFGRRRE